MDGLRVCGLPEAMETGELRRPDALCRWYVTAGLPNLSRDALRSAVRQALAVWPLVAGVASEEASSEDAATLVIRVAAIDGAQGVLADCQLPGPPVQLMRLDGGEQWTVQIGRDVPADLIDIVRVLSHEAGHYWGMGHAPQGSPNLMAPVYSRSIWTPQSWERDQMVSLYGPPRPAQPQPADRVASLMRIFDQTGAEMASYKIERVS